MICLVCGEDHGALGTLYAGIEIQACPKLPEDTLYEDREFEHGPRGVLHLLAQKRDHGR